MAQCKCKYYLRDSEGNLVCSVCGKPAHENEIEDKMQERHEDKAPLYISDKDRFIQSETKTKQEA